MPRGVGWDCCVGLWRGSSNYIPVGGSLGWILQSFFFVCLLSRLESAGLTRFLLSGGLDWLASRSLGKESLVGVRRSVWHGWGRSFFSFFFFVSGLGYDRLASCDITLHRTARASSFNRLLCTSYAVFGCSVMSAALDIRETPNALTGIKTPNSLV
ncbi:hypothetical protein B0I37DRAFT_376773 [Chaetomium sp. MPI-CAGE-AT-0009]|nr:hypothetical protein B0I37DRAFT_376773 [Chaetomium sp. MPI-CAGE-AT-0009]